MIASRRRRARGRSSREVCAQIADVQVRNRGTIGGNICANDPTNHLPPLMVALGARDDDRRRRTASATVAAEDFFLGVYMTAVGPGRAADAGHDPARAARRLRLGHDRRRRHLHRLGGGERSTAAPRVAIGCVDAVPHRAARARGAARRRPRAPRRRARPSPASARPSTRPATSTAAPTTAARSPRSSSRARSSRRAERARR